MSFGNGNGSGEIVISTPLRTAIGTYGGALKDTPATDLGATVGKEVLSRSGIEGEQVDQIIVGNILSAGQGMNPGRQVGQPQREKKRGAGPRARPPSVFGGPSSGAEKAVLRRGCEKRG